MPNPLFEMERFFCENYVWSNPFRLAACLVVLQRRGLSHHIINRLDISTKMTGHYLCSSSILGISPRD